MTLDRASLHVTEVRWGKACEGGRRVRLDPGEAGPEVGWDPAPREGAASRLDAPPGEDASLPAVLLLHGFTGSGEAWGRTVLDALAGGRTVLAVDLPGHGRSGV